MQLFHDIAKIAMQIGHKCLVSHCNFLVRARVTTATNMATLNPGTADTKEIPARIAACLRKLIGKVSESTQDEPLDIEQLQYQF